MINGIRVGYTLDEIHGFERKQPSLAAVLQSQTALIRRHEQNLLTLIEDRLWATRSPDDGMGNAETAEDIARASGFREGWMDCFSALAEIIESWGEAP